MLLDLVNNGLTLDRIIAYDFITIYSDIFDISEKSLGGENSFAFCEFAARRNLIKTAIKRLVIDGLVKVTDGSTGILYSISESGKQVSNDLHSEYAMTYRNILFLVIGKYGMDNDVQLLDEINRRSALFLQE